MPFDAIVYATGFDAMTGALVAVDIAGRDGLTLKQKWAAWPEHLPRADDRRLPELLHHHRAQSPSVLSNMMVSIEQHVDWIADCLASCSARRRR